MIPIVKKENKEYIFGEGILNMKKLGLSDEQLNECSDLGCPNNRYISDYHMSNIDQQEVIFIGGDYDGYYTTNLTSYDLYSLNFMGEI